MSSLTKKQRDDLPASAFGDPTGRKFPILDQDDLDSAASLIGKADNPNAVKARIITIANRLKLSIPDAWKGNEAADPGEANLQEVELLEWAPLVGVKP